MFKGVGWLYMNTLSEVLMVIPEGSVPCSIWVWESLPLLCWVLVPITIVVYMSLTGLGLWIKLITVRPLRLKKKKRNPEVLNDLLLVSVSNLEFSYFFSLIVAFALFLVIRAYFRYSFSSEWQWKTLCKEIVFKTEVLVYWKNVRT